MKFGVRSITFHNCIISEHGTEPKEANLCSIRNMSASKDIHQIRTFLGCCQQLSHYIKDYGIIAKPIHNITKKGTKYGLKVQITTWPSEDRLKAIVLDTNLYLHNK